MGDPINLDEIRLEVFKRTGINIGKDDPFFAAMSMLSVTAKTIEKKNDEALGEMRRVRDEIEHEVAKKLVALRPQLANQSPTPNNASLTIVMVIASFAAGFGSHNLPAIGLAAVGIIIGFLASQASFLFQKNQDDRQKLVNPAPKSAFIWTEADFQRAAARTMLSNRTRAACRDMLVDNTSIGMASTRHGVLPPQIFKGLAELRQSELTTRI